MEVVIDMEKTHIFDPETMLMIVWLNINTIDILIKVIKIVKIFNNIKRFEINRKLERINKKYDLKIYIIHIAENNKSDLKNNNLSITMFCQNI